MTLSLNKLQGPPSQSEQVIKQFWPTSSLISSTIHSTYTLTHIDAKNDEITTYIQGATMQLSPPL